MLLLFILALFTLQFTSIPFPEGNFVGATPIAKPGCLSKCGEVTVPYPFGINTIAKPAGDIKQNCSLDKTFELTCNMTSDSPKLFIGSGNLDIYYISDSEMRITNSVAYRCYDESGGWEGQTASTQLSKTKPFTFSQKNKFFVTGCDDYGWIRGPDDSDYTSGCMGLCINQTHVLNGSCGSGSGCCQTSIPKGFKFFNISLGTYQGHRNVSSFNPCSAAFLGDEDSFHFGGVPDLSRTSKLLSDSYVPVVLDWVIGGEKRNYSQVNECKGNSSYIDLPDLDGYRCNCSKGYEGNPYLDPGCQDIDECNDNRTYPCYGHCVNTLGSYNCPCLKGYEGNGKTESGCRRKASKFPVVILSLGMVIGFLAILSVVSGICFGIKKRKLIKLREKFFEQNGGEFMKQKLKATGTNDSMTVYNTEQLQKATDNYSEDRIIGRGGYGVVYKGILPDKRVVAIKKSKVVDGTQAEQFINEIWILTQVIHRNVVKLLGCCLEEEVPILVYEFISNNTLFYHIHNHSGGMSWLSWENRLRVAAEAASAIAYLHSQAAMPIIHRDVKSANILLDENYTAKISDFGASRLVPIDHNEVTTMVQGTLGYLDPEYFHTSQLTDKSDVYSFGMVLAELITGRKPICGGNTNEEKNLATYFVKSMKENRLFQIVEPRLLREGTLEKIQAVAELIKRCFNLLGEDRPTMKEVAMELEGLRKFTTHSWIPQQTPEESRSLTLEVEQSDLYDVPLIPYSSNEWESYSGTTEMAFQENKPR